MDNKNQKVHTQSNGGSNFSKKIIVGSLIVLVAVSVAIFFLTKDAMDQGIVDPLSKFSVISKEYDNASGPVSIDGKLAYIASANNQQFVVYDDKESKKYDIVKDLQSIQGKVAFVGGNSGNWSFIYDGQEIVQNQILISSVTEIEGKIAFLALGPDVTYYIYYGGIIMGEDYDKVGPPVEINNEIAFLASKGNEHFLTIQGEQKGKSYAEAFDLTPVENTYAFKARVGEKTVLVHDGKELSLEYDDVTEFVSHSGNLFFIVTRNGKFHVLYNTTKIAEEYDSAFLATMITGDLSFIAYQGKSTFIDTPDKKIEFIENSDENNRIAFIQNINDKLAYAVVRNGEYYVVYDGEEIGGPYDHIRASQPQNRSMIGIGGKIVFAALKEFKWHLVYDGESVAQYDDISNLTLTDSEKVAFNAKAGGKEFVVVGK